MQPLCLKSLVIENIQSGQACAVAYLVKIAESSHRVSEAVVSLCLHHQHLSVAYQHPVVVAFPLVCGLNLVLVETCSLVLKSVVICNDIFCVVQWLAVVHHYVRTVLRTLLLTDEQCLVAAHVAFLV